MKYFIQIYSNPSSRQAWESFSAEEQASGYEYYQRISDELAASGELVADEALADISSTGRTSMRPYSASGNRPAIWIARASDSQSTR